MIADPERVICDQLVALLKDHQEMDFRGCLSPPELVKCRINQFPPDLAFIRMGHPELSALGMVRFLRRINPEVKVVFIGGGETDAVEAFDYEGDGFLLLPFDEGAIARILLRWL